MPIIYLTWPALAWLSFWEAVLAGSGPDRPRDADIARRARPRARRPVPAQSRVVPFPLERAAKRRTAPLGDAAADVIELAGRSAG